LNFKGYFYFLICEISIKYYFINVIILRSILGTNISEGFLTYLGFAYS